MITKTQKITLLAELSNLFQSTDMFKLVQTGVGDYHASIKHCLGVLFAIDGDIYKRALSNRKLNQTNRHFDISNRASIIIDRFSNQLEYLIFTDTNVVDIDLLTQSSDTFCDSISEKVRFMIEQNF